MGADNGEVNHSLVFQVGAFHSDGASIAQGRTGLCGGALLAGLVADLASFFRWFSCHGGEGVYPCPKETINGSHASPVRLCNCYSFFLGLDCGKSIALMIFGSLYWVHGVGISSSISENGEGV